MGRRARLVEENDRMQRGYSYALIAPIGRDFDPEFRPELYPKQMLRLGVFGGNYMSDTRDENAGHTFLTGGTVPPARCTRVRLNARSQARGPAALDLAATHIWRLPDPRDCRSERSGLAAILPLIYLFVVSASRLESEYGRTARTGRFCPAGSAHAIRCGL